MEVAKIGENGLRIKSKLATIGVRKFPELSIEGESIIINGPGEYEIKGVKLTGLGKTTVLGYVGKIDGVDVCITKASILNTAKDSFVEYDMVIVDEDVLLEQSMLAKLNPSVAVLYGEKGAEHIKALGKEVTPVAKYVITRDKLPSEMEIVLLS